MDAGKMDWCPKSDEEMYAVVKQSLKALKILSNDLKLREQALFFKALGDETRLRIIGILRVQESCLCELAAGLGIPSSTLTHHLQILERGGVIQSRKEKKYTLFSLVSQQILDYYLTEAGELMK
ncbi:ArsR/SmtB family transcription factor [Paenibacillus timonensis]|uniref:ArsR/SmtB family transcription factor n=1 Tax=Paenibacillus timonensis TaxID=225915 RepID=UPI003F9EA392